MKTIRVIFLSLFAIGLVGCEKPMDLEKAIVVDWGPLETDGCGYMIELEDGSVVHPANLPIRFQQDGLEIGIEYTLKEDSYSCGLLTVMYDEISLESVRKW